MNLMQKTFSGLVEESMAEYREDNFHSERWQENIIAYSESFGEGSLTNDEALCVRNAYVFWQAALEANPGMNLWYDKALQLLSDEAWS